MTERSSLTARALVTGGLLGVPLAVCNIYAGLKIGWGFNMSVAAVLIGFVSWRGLGALTGGGPLTIRESNINQTAASAAASISSAGVVAAIPALTIMTGRTLSPVALATWLLSVSLVGIIVAIALRRSMMSSELPFPHGVAAAELLSQLHQVPVATSIADVTNSDKADGDEAPTVSGAARSVALVIAIALSAVVKAVVEVLSLERPTMPGWISVHRIRARRARRLTFAKLGFGIDPSLLMVGAGAVAGPRVGVSMGLGALVTWLVIAPHILQQRMVSWPKHAVVLYHDLVKDWLIWPGVALMVSASLSGFLISTGKVIYKRRRDGHEAHAATTTPSALGWRWLLGAAGVAALSTVLQVWLFEIVWWVAAGAVVLSFLLAVVAARVSGETGITPKGPMGKLTQLTFGLLHPQAPAANLMTACVTAGAAAQCGDLLHDLKTGALIGASPARQITAQLVGVIIGAIVAGVVYPMLMPDPVKLIGTDAWPAPAVQMWKAVAELLGSKNASLAPGVTQAILIASGVGLTLSVLEAVASKGWRRYLPGPASLGLAMVVPPYISLAIAAGGIGAWLVARLSPRRVPYIVVVGSGFIAGESLVGAVLAALGAG
ncbi:MAG: OPT/YSL family transporter [Myxococcales bacterium]|nr:OPT/YSL family transporter [Myxococcales bacterium]